MHAHRTVCIALALAAGFGLASCGESIGSESVKTDGIYADLSARADGSGKTKIHAGLKTGGKNSNTFLTIEGGDELNFYVDGDKKSPNEVDVVDQFKVYEKNVSKDAGGTEVKIELLRGDEEFQDAPNSKVTLPKKFEVTAPSSSDKFSRSSDDVQVKVNNTQQGTQMRVKVRGDCLEHGYSTGFDGKSVTIPSSELESEDDEEAPDECEASVEVKRIVGGQVDGAYSDGNFPGVQKRTASFTSTP